jgi:nucleoside-diphosphate-sugar epimerase
MNRHSSYTISKEIAEDLVHSYGSEFPVVVIRPAIIAAAYSEPEEGFVQGFQVKLEIIFLVFDFNFTFVGSERCAGIFDERIESRFET